VARLQPFDPSWTQGEYPIFKDPTKNFDQGAALCRMGFPFYDVRPYFDAASGNFKFPDRTFPLPIFVNEGVLSRMQEVVLVDLAGNPLQPAPPFPFRSIETSNPGLRGQSGGPVFDSKGTIWGIQSATASYQFDFNTKEKEHYHVGVATHPDTILGLFKMHNIKFKMSDY
jgi:hypothetical protein